MTHNYEGPRTKQHWIKVMVLPVSTGKDGKDLIQYAGHRGDGVWWVGTKPLTDRDICHKPSCDCGKYNIFGPVNFELLKGQEFDAPEDTPRSFMTGDSVSFSEPKWKDISEVLIGPDNKLKTQYMKIDFFGAGEYVGSVEAGTPTVQ